MQEQKYSPPSSLVLLTKLKTQSSCSIFAFTWTFYDFQTENDPDMNLDWLTFIDELQSTASVWEMNDW